MQPTERLKALIKRVADWQVRLSKQDPKFWGVRFDDEIPLNNDLPEQMKKDNAGWQYVNDSHDGSSGSNTG